MALRKVDLKDKYELEEGVAYMSGLQALTRIALVQRRRDIAAGLKTGGFISGYRGSPLGGFDLELYRIQKEFEKLDIRFEPGINEDLAATAIWGTQQINLLPGGSDYDGVFGIWYGKAPGVDRSGDVIRHANAYGTAPKGGVLALVGDDHACKSSTLPCQSDHVLYAYMVPQLYPANIQEFVEYGLLGIEMSRYSGCWTAMKVTSETVETSGTVDLSRENRTIIHPTDKEFQMPPGGVHIRLNDVPSEVDWRLQNFKLFACHAFARKNNIDRIVLDSPKPRFGIMTSGKSYGDVRQALIELGITEEIAQKIGLRIYKVGMTWPLEPTGVKEFAEDLEEILIVEEKRELIEYQLKQQLYNWDWKRRPTVVGKYDEHKNILLPLDNDQSVGLVSRVIAQRIKRFYHSEKVEACLSFYREYEEKTASYTPSSLRKPYYCAGCPHNTSTKVPEGSFAMVGIGCHYMVQWMDRSSAMCTQMGGEGVPFIGQAPYTKKKHIFANLGDGTYSHSGLLAIRAAVASGVNITYKILYNDAVAMTGGQPVEGGLTPVMVARQVIAEGVKKCWIISERPESYEGVKNLPEGVPVLHREWLDKIQDEARNTEGCTIIVYDQTCAAEKRRRRKRGKYPDPAKRVFINKSVCEGCGDCSVQSNCVAVQPVETEFGRKREINQSLCNKDFSCLKGFCPSFVTVHGGELRKTSAQDNSADVFANLPEAEIPSAEHAYNILISGIGGTGVLTVGALLGMAAHLEGKRSAILDQTGLAQKGGEVISHVRISEDQDELRTAHIIAGGTDLLLACDIVSAAGKGAFETLNSKKTKAVINDHNTPTAAFVLDNKVDFKEQELRKSLKDSTFQQNFVEASKYALALLGDEIGTNVFMLGYAWQQGLLPVSREALEKAIELNGVAIEMNKKAFSYGRLAAHNPEKIEDLAQAVLGSGNEETISASVDEIIEKRIQVLTEYQNKAYADRYVTAVAEVRKTEESLKGHNPELPLTEAVARYYFKLLAYKDEYEVARLYTNGSFMNDLKSRFTGDFKLEFHMAPPIFEKEDPATGRPRKRTFGPWMLTALQVLAKLKFLRGTPLDPFGYNKERKTERELIKQYEELIEITLPNLSVENYNLCIEIFSLPDDIRGFGPVKERHRRMAKIKQAELTTRLAKGQEKSKAAA